MMKEIWKKINEYEENYEISNLGNVRSLSHKVKSGIKNQDYIVMRGKTLRIYQDRPNDYKYVKLSKNNKVIKKYVHRLVATAFIPNPSNMPQVNHKDGNKGNNNVNNLEWTTCLENIHHAFRNNLVSIKHGAEHHYAKKIIQYDINGNFIKAWGSISDAASQLKICRTAIANCCRYKPHHHTAGGFKWKWNENL